MLSIRPQLLVLVLGVIGAIVIVSCTGSSAEKAVVEPTATFSPADATATWVAFRPEMDRLTAAARGQQIVEATIAAATAGAEQPDLATDARPVSEADTASGDSNGGTTLEPTPVPAANPNPPPPRAIATGDVDRIAFSDGRGSVHTVNPDGAELATVARGSLLSREFHYTFPVWSPDGGSLVFSSFLIVENSVVQSALHRAEADGNGPISR